MCCPPCQRGEIDVFFPEIVFIRGILIAVIAQNSLQNGVFAVKFQIGGVYVFEYSAVFRLGRIFEIHRIFVGLVAAVICRFQRYFKA